jgi:hypothetical protein
MPGSVGHGVAADNQFERPGRTVRVYNLPADSEKVDPRIP